MSEIYERLLNEELKTAPKQKTIPTKKIGSIHLNRINFKGQNFFHSENIPDKAKETKQYIQSLIDPDRLKMNEREWCNSVYIDKKLKHHDKNIQDV